MDVVDATIERLGLKDMFARATREGLWFWCGYQDLWFSPDQLRASLADGKFRWASDNWELRAPTEKLDSLKAREATARGEREAFETILAANTERRQ